jgi:1-acyl-sn-glycerol-3-phosphate acyltransferase
LLDFLKNIIKLPSPPKIDKIFRDLQKRHGNQDAWGLNLKAAKKNVLRMYPLYKKYFQVRVFGKENVKDVPYMVVANHTGQVAIDGMLISLAFTTEVKPPRILRPMVERFFTNLPFVGMWAQDGGAVLGDRQNCLNLLKNNNSVLVFPEGVRGIAKSTKDYYKLQKFTRGHYRLALLAGVEILPVTVIGAEEFFPFVYQAKGVAKLLGLPAAPITPNIVPLPSPVDIYIGEPIKLPEELSADSPDNIIDEHVYEVEERIKDMIDIGLGKRRPFWGNQK